MSEIEFVAGTKNPFIVKLAPVGAVTPAVNPSQNLASKVLSLIQQKQQNRLDPNLKRKNQIETDLRNLLSQQEPSVLANAMSILQNQLYTADANKANILQEAIKTLDEVLNSPARRLDNRFNAIMSVIKEKTDSEISNIVMNDNIIGELIGNITDFKILDELVERLNAKPIEGEGFITVKENIKLAMALQYMNIYQNLKDTPENKELLLKGMSKLVESMRDNRVRNGLTEYVNGNVHRLIELSQQLSNPRNLNRLNSIESDIKDLIASANPEIFEWSIVLIQQKLDALNDPNKQTENTKEEMVILMKAIKHLEELNQAKTATAVIKIERTKPTLGSFLQNIAKKLKKKSFTEQIFNLTEALSTSELQGKLLTQVNKLINRTNDPLKLEAAADHLAAKMTDKEYLKAEYPSPEALRRFQISAEQVVEKLRDKAARYLSFDKHLKYHIDKLYNEQKDLSKNLAVPEIIDTLIQKATIAQLTSAEDYLKGKLDKFYADSVYRTLFLNVHAQVSERLSSLTGQQPKSAEAVVKAPSAPLPQSKESKASRESLQLSDKELEALRYPQAIDEESSEKPVKGPSFKNKLFAIVVNFAKVKDTEGDRAQTIVEKITRLIAKASVEEIGVALKDFRNKKAPANLSALEKQNFEIVLKGVRSDLEGALASKTPPIPPKPSMKTKVPRYVKSAEEPARTAAEKGKADAVESAEEKFKSKK